MDQPDAKSLTPIFEKVASLKAYKCSRCNRIYSAQVHSNIITGRIPLLMPCSHTVCEECMRVIQKEKNISCKVCKYDMRIEEDVLRNLFPIDRYMFGALLNLNLPYSKPNFNFLGNRKSTVLPFQPAGSSLKTKHSNMSERHSHSEDGCSQQDCSKVAEWKCVNCAEFYCSKCDKRIHNSIRILRNHIRYPKDMANLTDFNVACAGHPQTTAEYSCITCESLLCSKCVIKDHAGHEIISIEDKNAQEVTSLKDTLMKAKRVLKCMEFTKQKVELELNNSRQNLKPCQTEYEIIKYFAGLHSRLQLLENQMLEDFYRAKAAKMDSLHQLFTELQGHLSSIGPIVATGTLITSSDGAEHMDKLLISKLEESLSSCITLPCELVEESKEADNIQFIVDETLTNLLEKHCQIVAEESVSYKLEPITDFERNYPEVNLDEESNSDSARSRCTSTSSQNSKSGPHEYTYTQPGCKTRVSLSGTVPIMYKPNNLSPEPKPEEPLVFVPGTLETVTVTHVNNPSDFYVQLYRKRIDIEKLTNRYEIYAKKAKTPASPECGNTYIVQFTSEKISKWYRAQIMSILTPGVIDMYEVFYIDYGNTAVVAKSSIKEMKQSFMQEPPFAHRCRLNGITSQGTEWSDTVLEYMIQFITSRTDPPLDPDELTALLITGKRTNNLKMHVIRNEKQVLNVDLISYGESLNSGLIFMGHAQYDTESHEVTKQKKICKDHIIVSAIRNFSKDQVYKVLVTYVESPNLLFIQLYDNNAIIRKMELNLKKQYEKNDNKSLIFAPEKGMFCAANLSWNKNKWRRVEITDIIGEGRVEVFSVDYGVSEVIPWNQLRKLADTHRQTDAQAIKVSLTDIAPKISKEWPSETTKFLSEYVKNKMLSMYVNEPSKNQLCVTLYENTNCSDICINALLVRENLAESTGESSLLVEYHKILPGEYDQQNTHRLEQLLTEYNASGTIQQPQTMIRNNQFFISVEILLIESPSCFYVTLPKWADEKRNLSQKLHQFYATRTPEEKPWAIDSKCAVFSPQDKTYYRGIVKNVLEDTKEYEVFLKDIVRTETVPGKNLFDLDQIFTRVHDFSIRCRLGAVRPAGGSDKWSKIASEFFSDLVAKYPLLYITKMEPPEDKVLPVCLTAIWEENNGPLEPSTFTYMALNKCLVDEGLALPVKVERPLSISEKEDGLEKLAESSFQDEESSDADEMVFQGKKLEETTLEIRDKFQSKKQESWLPPYKITEKKFKGWPTYVDHEGGLFIHTMKAKNTLENIQRIMMKHFGNTKPDPPHPWVPGQMCSVLYHNDQLFYRGVVLGTTNDDKIRVKMVDYGNEEECDHAELRRETIMTEIPIMVTKFTLAEVLPKSKDGSWPVVVLDVIHQILVEKEVEVTIQNDNLSETPLRAIIHLENRCINSEIMDWDWAALEKLPLSSAPQEAGITLKGDDDDDDSVVIEEEIANKNRKVEAAELNSDVSDSDESEKEILQELRVDSESPYKKVEVPKEASSFNAVVINIIDFRTVLMEPEFLVESLQNTSTEFEQMLRDMNAEAPELPEVKDPAPGMACVALFSADNQWYRAEMYSISASKQKVLVLFVDYGNLEVVSRSKIKVIKPEWLEFPVQMLTCKIWDVQKPKDMTSDEVVKAMSEVVVDKEVVCEIMARDPELEVKLISPSNYELIYRDLIDKGIIEISD